MSTLIVALPYPAASTPAASWAWARTPDGRTLSDHGNAALALLPQADELVLMVPMQALSWHRIELPRAPAKRLRAALDGLLEEQLLDEPQTLHMALQPLARPGTPTWVAACDKAWLQAALQWFELAQRPVMRLVPEVAPAGAADTGAPRAWVTGSAEQAWIVSTGEGGVLNLPLASFPGSEIDLPGLELLADPPVAALAEQVLARKVRVVHPAERLLAAAQSQWDLALFDLLHTGAARRLRGAKRQWRSLLDAPQWRPLRWGVLLLLLINLGGLNAWAWKEQRSLEAKRSEVRDLLVRSFPGVKVIVDAPLQMEREVVSLQRGGGLASARDLESMLASLTALLPPGRSASGIEYTAGELTLKGLAFSGAEFTAIQTRLAALGYRASGEGDRLVIRTATAS